MGDIEIILPMKFKQKWFIMNKNHFKRIKLRIIETGSLLCIVKKGSYNEKNINNRIQIMIFKTILVVHHQMFIQFIVFFELIFSQKINKSHYNLNLRKPLDAQASLKGENASQMLILDFSLKPQLCSFAFPIGLPYKLLGNSELVLKRNLSLSVFN